MRAVRLATRPPIRGDSVPLKRWRTLSALQRRGSSRNGAARQHLPQKRKVGLLAQGGKGRVVMVGQCDEGGTEQAAAKIRIVLRSCALQPLEHGVGLLAVGDVFRLILAVLGDVIVQRRIGLLVIRANLKCCGPKQWSVWRICDFVRDANSYGDVAAQDVDRGLRLSQHTLATF